MKISSMQPIIISDNTEKTLEFYSALGFTTKLTSTTEFGSPVYVVANGDVELEIMEASKNTPIPMSVGLHGLRINVDDIDAAVEAFKQNGGTILAGPFESESRKVFAALDANGNNITIMKGY